MTWQPGSDRIQRLLDDGELERVIPDQAVAGRLLRDAGKHLTTAAAAVTDTDLSGAYQLAYDALRKSAAALLAVQGLRATSRGGHIAIQDAVAATQQDRSQQTSPRGSSRQMIKPPDRRRARSRLEGAMPMTVRCIQSAAAPRA